MTFFDKYSYRQKNIALIVLSILLLAVAYKKAFSITIDSIEYRQDLLLKLERAKHADMDIRSNQIQIAKLNKFLGDENSSVEKVQQGFLNFFADHAEDVVVYQIDEVLNYKHPDFEINTHRIVLKGSFVPTLKFIYSIEKDFSYAKILNVEFELKQNSIEDEVALYTTILIQNYLK